MGGLNEEVAASYFDMEAYEADQELAAEERRELAEELSVTYMLNFYLHSETVEMSEAVEELISELRETKAAKNTHKSNLNRCINTLVANLVSNYGSDPDRYTIYGRDDKDYPAQRYNPFEIKLRGAIAVADGLEELGYAENHIGFKLWKYYYGRKSRIRATPKFIDMLEQRTGLTPDHIKKYDIPELVVLRAKGEKRGKLKRDIDYPETHQIKRMRDQLKSYNKMLDAAEITINPSFELPDGSSHNLNNKSYHRVFNRGSFELGGRYTGPWWQNASKAIRGQILIEGKSTVECDYKAQHVHILYHLAGVSYFDLHGESDDPYAVEGYGPEHRDLFKKTFLKLTGVKNRKGLNIGMGQWVATEPNYKGIDHKSASSAFITKHRSILPLLYRKYDKNLSLKLQNLDSRISEHIITELLNDGIIALDIHDSFIVQRRYEKRLRDVMVNGFKAESIISIPEITNNL